MISIKNVDGGSFRDTTILAAYQRDGTLLIHIEYYAQSNEMDGTCHPEVLAWSVITISGIERIMTMDRSIPSFSMESEDGEVLDFEWVSDELHLLLYWSRYQGRRGDLQVYRFIGSNLAVSVSACAENTVLSTLLPS